MHPEMEFDEDITWFLCSKSGRIFFGAVILAVIAFLCIMELFIYVVLSYEKPDDKMEPWKNDVPIFDSGHGWNEESIGEKSEVDTNESSKKHDLNKTRIAEVLGDLCSSFDEGLISGDLCLRLCYRRTWVVVDYYEGNKTVLVMKDGDRTVVYKSSLSATTEFPDLKNLTDDEFSEMVVDIVNDELRLGFPRHYKKHLLGMVWPMFHKSHGQSLTIADRTSLWALLQQPEFILFRIIPFSGVTPRIIGTCGQYYVPEEVFPFHTLRLYFSREYKIIELTMGTLKLFDQFINEPLQWCDARLDNFGVLPGLKKRFVLMDADMVYTQSRLRAELEGRPCLTDADCRIGDCKATCTVDMTCSDRVDTNLEVFCEKVARKRFSYRFFKQNSYLTACLESTGNISQRLDGLRLTWSWSLFDVV
ncbi:hypothetical protein Q1695_009127 [Nippostrongylus brasiliensis]|nr:hypothetical protein Q1695_009127 [Nippostrongylus brasiliensis]